jgi:hypothetical protein
VKGDLERLIAAVEAGTFLMDVLTPGDCERDAYSAFSGSLDAALRLHEALLPGSWYQISHWPMPNMTLVRVGSFEGRDDIPARAWLLAILRALAKREEG